MAMILRKVWGSVSNRPGSSSSSSSDRNRIFSSSSSSSSSLSLGAFDQLPADILMQILRTIGAKDAMKMSVLCKSWKSLISDNLLWIFFLQNHPSESWDSIFFAETSLRSGYPLQAFPTQMPELSFMRIYSQRMRVPGSVIIDGGSGYCKFGWSKYAGPSGKSATFLEFGNIETPMYSRLRPFFATIYSRMQVKPSNQPIVVSVPICHYDDTESAKASRQQLKKTMYSALFDMNVPAVCAINQNFPRRGSFCKPVVRTHANFFVSMVHEYDRVPILQINLTIWMLRAILALYAARRTSGIVVNIGFQVTSVVPILHGKVMRKVGVEVVGVGALKLTGFLKELMQLNNINFGSLYTVRTLKENLCYVAADYEAELSKNMPASFEITGEGPITLSKERFQTGEILFQPSIGGVRAMGLHQAVALCMDHCHDAELTGDDAWFKTVVLSGGSACLPGLAERLEKELHGLLPASISNGIRVIPPPYGADTAWFGAKLVSNLSNFPGPWCVTKKQSGLKSKLNLMW